MLFPQEMIISTSSVVRDTKDSGVSHNDFCSIAYKRCFLRNISYIAWKDLPSGVKEKPHKDPRQRYIFSLTSWPPRTSPKTLGIWLTIESLLLQKQKPDRIILWLSEEEYPLRILPQTLIDQEKRGLEIIFEPENDGAGKKLIPALRSGIEGNIITVDDDHIYPRDWLSRHIKKNIHNNHTSIVGSLYCNIMEDNVLLPDNKWNWNFSDKRRLLLPIGACGVLYPFDKSERTYNGLDKRVINKQYKDFYSKTDDLWFFLCRILAETKFSPLPFNKERIKNLCLPAPLHPINSARRNDVVMVKMLKQFPEFREKLGVEIPQSLILFKPNLVREIFKKGEKEDDIQSGNTQ